MLLYFGRVYSRHYLKTWSYSWLAFALAAFCLGFVTLYGLYRTDIIRLAMSIVAQIGTFFHLFFLLAGLYELTRGSKVRTKTLVFVSVVIVVMALLSTLSYNNVTGAEATQGRYLLRTVLRMFLIAVCFITAAGIVWRTPQFTRNLGQRIMTLTFFGYGLVYLYYSRLACWRISEFRFHSLSFLE